VVEHNTVISSVSLYPAHHFRDLPELEEVFGSKSAEDDYQFRFDKIQCSIEKLA
jgi:hypothetical protein